MAEKAVPQLEAEAQRVGVDVRAHLSGKVSDLLAALDANGIQKAVICSIATKPEQFAPILKWSREIATERLIPLASIHPADPRRVERVAEIRAAGLLGIKLHPYYQNFVFDDERLFPFYAAIEAAGLILLLHAGFDLAFPRDRVGDPARIRRVIDRFPRLKLVAAHMGAWEDWDEVRKHLLGRPVYLDTSFFVDYIDRAAAIEMLRAHPREYILFATDSPWAGHREELERIRSLELGAELEERIFFKNAEALLASANGRDQG